MKASKVASYILLTLAALLTSCKGATGDTGITGITGITDITGGTGDNRAWVVSTLAGSGTADYAEGAGTEARFNRPSGVAVDSLDNIYVADFSNNRVRKITPAGVVSTIAGTGKAGSDDTDITTNPGTEAQFNRPTGVAVDKKGNIYVADYFNNRVRKITPAGVVSTIAGNGMAGYAEGAGTAAWFDSPLGVTVDSSGNIYVADRNNHRIRKITITSDGTASTASVDTIAGTGKAGFDDTDITTNPGTAARFNCPYGVAVDSSGNIYVADYFNNRIRKITPAGVVSTIAGSGKAGYAEGAGTAARFNNPSGVAVDSSGNIYVADQHNYRIRKIEYK